jgi:hypothetical protein
MNAHTGDKNAAVCRSDDQFFLHDYAVTRGMEVRLEPKKVFSDQELLRDRHDHCAGTQRLVPGAV